MCVGATGTQDSTCWVEGRLQSFREHRVEPVSTNLTLPAPLVYTRMVRHAALYEELAQYYDQIYHWKDYPKEVRKLKTLIKKYQRSSGKDLLDVACGTGRHLSYLQRDFDCMGVDSSEQMLAMARKNAPDVQFLKGDILDFDVDRRFDVVMCLFSSIGYLKTRREVTTAVTNLARHIKEGGVLIIEPWLRKSAWADKTVHMQCYENDSLKIARVSFTHADGDISVLDERYLVAKKGEGVSYIKDLHKMRFFELEPTLLALREAGLVPRFTEDSLMPGRGLVIATKPLPLSLDGRRHDPSTKRHLNIPEYSIPTWNRRR